MSKTALCTKVLDFVKNNKQLLLGFSLFSLLFFKLYVVVFFLPLVYFHLLNKLNPQYNPSNSEHREYYWSFIVISIAQLILITVGISLAVFVAHTGGFLGLVVGLVIGYITSYLFVNSHAAYAYLFLNDVTIIQALSEGKNLYNQLGSKRKRNILTCFSLGFFLLGLLSLFCYSEVFVFIASFLLFVLTVVTSFLSVQKEAEEAAEAPCPLECANKANVRSFVEKVLDPQSYVNLVLWFVKLFFDTIAGIFQTLYAIVGDIREAFVYSEDSTKKSSTEVKVAKTEEVSEKSEEPAKAEEPAQVETAKAEESAQAEPATAEEPAQAEPATAEEPAQAETAKAEEPAQAEPVKAEEPVEAQTAKADDEAEKAQSEAEEQAPTSIEPEVNDNKSSKA